MLPNFFILGAPKAGTTSLHSYLGQHPEIYMSPVKEPRFFSVVDANGNVCAGKDVSLDNAVTSLHDYEELFGDVHGEKAVGEATPSYLHNVHAMEHIRSRVPDARLIAVLRDPVDRAYSGFFQHVRTGRISRPDFNSTVYEAAASDNADWYLDLPFLARSFYAAAVNRYIDNFGVDQVMVCLYEDLLNRPVMLCKEIYRFLGVDIEFEPDVTVRHNAGFMPRNNRLYQIVRRSRGLRAAVNLLLPRGMAKRAAATVKQHNVAKVPPMDPSMRKFLIGLYRDDILEVERLTGRDLSDWLKT